MVTLFVLSEVDVKISDLLLHLESVRHNVQFSEALYAV